MLRVEHLRIGELTPLSFEVADGRALVIGGPSGSGKTRVLRAIADLDPAAGQIFLDGHERMEMSAPEWRRRVRFAAAEPHWWTDTPRAAFDISGERSARLDRMLSALGLDSDAIDRPVSMLSTGERQRLALARAVADEPKVLLLDEPTSALDAGSAALVEELVRYQLIAGRIVILATHDRGLAGRLANERLMLDRAREPAGSPDVVPGVGGQA